jgi:2-isopropylmalate synthase
MLDYFGVDFVEISPIVSRDHEESCRKMVRAGLSAGIVAHLRALPEDIDVALRCGVEWVAMYHSVSDIHLQYKLKVSREEAIDRSLRAIEYAKAHGLKLRFTMEDTSRADPAFVREFVKAIVDAGADRIGVADTLGVLKPTGMSRLVQLVRGVTDRPIDLHCHNDLGLALANALAGLEAGGDQIHVSVNGLGERVGIVPLAEAALALILLYGVELNVRLEMLRELSDLVAQYSGVPTPPSQPIVGDNAYKHKAGTHVAAIIRNPFAYELVPPRVVGNRRRVIFGELSGRNTAAFLMRVLGLNYSSEGAGKLTRALKELRIGDLFELPLTEEMEARLKVE